MPAVLEGVGVGGRGVGVGVLVGSTPLPCQEAVQFTVPDHVPHEVPK